jgi:hypothetical protein
MPYIEEYARIEFDRPLVELSHMISTPGELNYVITKLCDAYAGRPLSYRDVNEVIGVLECAKQEFYRMVASPYENRKRQENGNVYDAIV